MVAMNDHDHGDGEMCPGCRFKAALAEHLDWAADQDDYYWYDAVGEITTLLTGTLTALTRLRAQRLEPHPHDGEELHVEAAAGISRLGGAIQELWHTLMDDDAGAGL